MKELIKVVKNENGNEVVNARDLHRGVVKEAKGGQIGEDFSHWIKRMINYGFIKDIDYTVVKFNYKGDAIFSESDNQTVAKIEYALTLDCAKQIAMLQNNDKGREYRLYFIRIEKLLKDIAFKIGDKKHQLNCMEQLQHLLPEDFKQEKISYIKANTVVNKAVSNAFGFPKMIKKLDMNNDMLMVRESVLDDYIKLFDVLEDNSEVKKVLYKKYSGKSLTV